MILDIKPLSVNEAWQGKRYKTNKYRRYEREALTILRPFKVPEGELKITLTFGFSSPLSDFDNPVKPFVDILQKKYGFNDNRIKKAEINVTNVAKGREFIEWNLSEANN